jgi:type II secretion system protein N
MDRLKPLLRVAGYSAWFSLALTLFLWLTFPWGRLADRLTVAAADKGVAFTTQALRPALVGAKAKGMLVGPLGKGEETAAWLQAERLRVTSSMGGALSTALAVRSISAAGGAESQADLMRRLLAALGEVDLDGEMYGADVGLALTDQDQEAMRVALTTGRLDLSAYPLPSGLLSGSPQGRLQAEADVLWHWEDPKKTSGTVDLNFAGLQLEGLKIAGMGMPAMTFDRAEAHLKMAKGRAEFRNTAFEADVFDLEVEGFINLKPNVLASTLSLRVKFKVRDDLEGLLSMAGLKKDSRHRDTEGWFHYQGQGRITSPRFTERRVARTSSARSTKPAIKPEMGDDDDDEEKSPATRAVRRTTGKISPDEDEEEEPISRDPMSDERRQEIEEQRAALREERLRRREERRLKREELMEKRRLQQESGEFDNGRTISRPLPADEFERTNDLEEDVQPEEPDPDGLEDDGTEEADPIDGGDEGDYEE